MSALRSSGAIISPGGGGAGGLSESEVQDLIDASVAARHTRGSASGAAGFNVTLPTATSPSTGRYCIRVSWNKVSGTTGFMQFKFGAGAGSAPTNAHESHVERTAVAQTSGTSANAYVMAGSVQDKGTLVLTIDKNSKTWHHLVAGKAPSGASGANVQAGGGGWDTDAPTEIRIENSGASASFDWEYSIEEV